MQDESEAPARNVNHDSSSHASRDSSSKFESTSDGEQVVLILVGLIGSGKSTFAEALQEQFPKFRRCNQDDLGNRRAVEGLARQSLQQGMSVCIDRTNFDAAQRKHWVNIAREFPGTLIWVIVFDTPYEVCKERIQKRVSHPTIKSPEQGLSVLQRFASDFQPPQPFEGFDRILSLNTTVYPTPTFSRSDIAEILQRIRDSAPPNVGRIQPVWSLYPKHQQRGFGRGHFGTSNIHYGHSFQWTRGRGRAGTGPSNSQVTVGPMRTTRRDTPIGGWRKTGNKHDPSAVD